MKNLKERFWGASKDLVDYLVGLFQAASAALLASAIIVPNERLGALLGCLFSSACGAILIVWRGNKE